MLFPNPDFCVEDLICDEGFQRYCLGCDPELQVSWDNWVNSLPHRADDIREATRLLDILHAKRGGRVVQFRELESGMRQRELFAASIAPVAEGILGRPKRAALAYYGVAAVAACVLIMLVFFLKKQVAPILESPAVTEFSSGIVPRKTIILEDGTIVTLSKQTVVRLKTGFNHASRELWLEGEAFFDVHHNASLPFIVHTAYNDIQVLGTTFNVKAYSQDPAMETALLRGSVRVVPKGHPELTVVLKPNEKLIAEQDSKFRNDKPNKAYKVVIFRDSTTSVAPKELMWLRKRLEIDDQPLSAIAKQLENWYGIKIIIEDDALKHYRYSGVFENETIVKTLEALQLSYPFKFIIRQDEIILKKP